MAPDVEAALLVRLDDQGVVEDSGDYASETGVDHARLVEVIKSLVATDMITSEVRLLRR